MSKKYDRHIDILNCLRHGERRTYNRLSDEFRVSLKTIKKDIFELAYFFPIDVYRGRYGGVELRRGYVINGYLMKKSDLEILTEALEKLRKEKDSTEIKKLIKMVTPKEK